LTKQVYGWKKDKADTRDYEYVPKTTVLPPLVDLRLKCPGIYDQGQLGSCTANAAAGVLEFDMLLQGETDATPSRLFIYYNTRDIEGTTQEDSGASIRDTIKSVTQFGACPESEWPYDISQFTVKPDVRSYTDGLLHKAVIYKKVGHSQKALKAALASGRPVIFGFTCYESLEYDTTTQTGYIPYPKKSEQEIGGHAIELVGYDDSQEKFFIRNSWGTRWGLSGYGSMDYKYITSKLASDFWVVETVE